MLYDIRIQPDDYDSEKYMVVIYAETDPHNPLGETFHIIGRVLRRVSRERAVQELPAIGEAFECGMLAVAAKIQNRLDYDLDLVSEGEAVVKGSVKLTRMLKKHRARKHAELVRADPNVRKED